MLDQNTASFLSTLLGGLLTISGGILANYYIQSSSNKLQKRKEIRNIVENIYKSMDSISSNYHLMLFEINDKNFVCYTAIKEKLDAIETMVNLYLSPLEKDFLEYQEAVLSSLSVSLKSSPPEVKVIVPNKIEETAKQLRRSLASMLKEKGYSYL